MKLVLAVELVLLIRLKIIFFIFPLMKHLKWLLLNVNLRNVNGAREAKKRTLINKVEDQMYRCALPTRETQQQLELH